MYVCSPTTSIAKSRTFVCYHYPLPLGLINHRTQLCLARSTQSTQASGLGQSEFVSKDITTKEVST